MHCLSLRKNSAGESEQDSLMSSDGLTAFLTRDFILLEYDAVLIGD